MSGSIIYYPSQVADQFPVITVQPTDQLVPTGGTGTFTSGSTGGDAPVTCIWQEEVSPGVWQDIPGETGVDLVVTEGGGAPSGTPAIIDSGLDYQNNSNDPQPTITLPVGLQTGDVVVAFCIADGPGEASSDPRIWTNPPSGIALSGMPNQSSAFFPSVNVWTVAVDASDSGTAWTFGADNTSQQTVGWILLRDTSSVALGTTLFPTATASSYTSAANTIPTNGIHISILGLQGSGTSEAGPPAGMNLLMSNTPDWRTSAVAEETYPSGGSTGTTTWNLDSNDQGVIVNVIVS